MRPEMSVELPFKALARSILVLAPSLLGLRTTDGAARSSPFQDGLEAPNSQPIAVIWPVVALNRLTSMRKQTVLLNHRQRGVSMVEVLISMMVIAMGLLGISGLMVSSINNAITTDVSSRATEAAHSIMDSIRGNTVFAGQFNTDYGLDTTTLSGTNPIDIDRKLWLQAIRALPGTDGKINYDSLSDITSIEVRIDDCIGGTLNATEKTKCISKNNNDYKRIILFQMKINRAL